MAQAHVAGVAALLIAARPDFSVSRLRYTLTSTAAFYRRWAAARTRIMAGGW